MTVCTVLRKTKTRGNTFVTAVSKTIIRTCFFASPHRCETKTLDDVLVTLCEHIT